MSDNDLKMDPTPEETPWELTDSANIHSIRREPSGTVGIRFKNKAGAITGTYHYEGISAEQFEAMRAADSIGSYFHSNIKGQYDAKKQEG